MTILVTTATTAGSNLSPLIQEYMEARAFMYGQRQWEDPEKEKAGDKWDRHAGTIYIFRVRADKFVAGLRLITPDASGLLPCDTQFAEAGVTREGPRGEMELSRAVSPTGMCGAWPLYHAVRNFLLKHEVPSVVAIQLRRYADDLARRGNAQFSSERLADDRTLMMKRGGYPFVAVRYRPSASSVLTRSIAELVAV